MQSWQTEKCSQTAVLVAACLWIMSSGCAPLRPKAITADRYYLSEQLIDEQPQIQRGKPRKVIDTTGWVLGIPNKILLWNRRIDNHNIGLRTESVMAEYLAVNGLETTRVRLNQYNPSEDWRRLVKNKRVGAAWRYTLGTAFTLYETVLPGRVFGGDHYNPFTDTIHLYSDVPAIALHEASHAKDFARREYKGTYAAVYCLPGIPLWHESIASADSLAYSQMYLVNEEQKEAYNVLYPAYGTYVGSAMGPIVPKYASPVYYGSVVTGHVWGRMISRRLPNDSGVQAELQTVENYPLGGAQAN